MSDVRDIRICEIRQDKTQSRAEYNREAIGDYADLLTDGVSLPPADVYWDGKEYWCGDGFHRLSSASTIGWDAYPCIVHEGGERDAMLHSIRANAEHGIRRTGKDKRHAVTFALSDAELRQWSNRKLAAYCRVGADLVADVREKIELTETAVDESPKRIGKDGKKRIVKPKADKPTKDEPKPANSDQDEPTSPVDDTDASFDTKAIESQLAPDPVKKKPGKPKVSRKERTAAQKHLGGLIRSLSAMDIYDEFSELLSQIAERLKTI